jgi:TolA-binding protein
MGELIGLAAVVLIFGIPLLAIWTSHQQKIAKMQVESTAENTAEKAAQYATQIQRLEDRVQVLERIVTDKGYDVATQIEALRDARSHHDAASGTPMSFESRERV